MYLSISPGDVGGGAYYAHERITTWGLYPYFILFREKKIPWRILMWIMRFGGEQASAVFVRLLRLMWPTQNGIIWKGVKLWWGKKMVWSGWWSNGRRRLKGWDERWVPGGVKYGIETRDVGGWVHVLKNHIWNGVCKCEIWHEYFTLIIRNIMIFVQGWKKV